jgi:hypothetical protein
VRPQDEHNLRSLLHSEAERHVPDRDAMLARINGRRGSARHGVMSIFRQPVGPGARRTMAVIRPVAAALAVAGVLVAAVTGINLAGGPPGPQVAGPGATAGPSSDTTWSEPAANATTEAPAVAGRPPVRDGYLSATAVLDPHSIDSWSQGNLTLFTTEEITALDVTVRVARTSGVTDTGHWTTIPLEMITSTTTSTGKDLVYHYTLKPGGRLAPGNYTFAVQYNHATGGRAVTGDSYEATTTAAGPAHVTGHFTG